MVDLRAVFWDVDGTLADTEMEGHRVAFNQAFAIAGLPWDWDRNTYAELLRVPGGGARIKTFARQKGLELNAQQLQELRVLKHKSYIERIRGGHVIWRPGVMRLIEELTRANMQQWIVTTSGNDSVRELIHHAFPQGHSPFIGWVTADLVQRRKPHPEAYQYALKKSGFNAIQCLAIEDSTVGFRSATSAGLPCLLTPSPWDKALEDLFKQAMAVINHFGDTNQPCKVIYGPPCATAQITLEYLLNLNAEIAHP